MSINHLILKASGLSTDLDVTLSSLASSLEEQSQIDAEDIIQSLKDKISELQDSLDEAVLLYGNRAVTNEQLYATKTQINQQLNDYPDRIHWFIANYTESFFAGIEEPMIRKILCEELSRFILANPGLKLKVPELWTGIVRNNGLIKA